MATLTTGWSSSSRVTLYWSRRKSSSENSASTLCDLQHRRAARPDADLGELELRLRQQRQLDVALDRHLGAERRGRHAFEPLAIIAPLDEARHDEGRADGEDDQHADEHEYAVEHMRRDPPRRVRSVGKPLPRVTRAMACLHGRIWALSGPLCRARAWRRRACRAYIGRTENKKRFVKPRAASAPRGRQQGTA